MSPNVPQSGETWQLKELPNSLITVEEFTGPGAGQADGHVIFRNQPLGSQESMELRPFLRAYEPVPSVPQSGSGPAVGGGAANP